MHVLFFDIDGTLLNSGGAGRIAFEAALEEEFGVPEMNGRVPYSGRTDRAIMRDLLRLHDIEDSADNIKKLIAGYLSRLPASLLANQGTVLPGITELLRHCMVRDDMAVGLLTGNMREGARRKLGHFKLFDFFAFGGYGDDHWERDDVAHEALSAVKQFLCREVDCDRVWVIGDTPLDVRCARAIGAKAVAVATGWHSAEELADSGPDLLLTDLSDMQLLLARING